MLRREGILKRMVTAIVPDRGAFLRRRFPHGTDAVALLRVCGPRMVEVV